jgi:hypothetical protein
MPSKLSNMPTLGPAEWGDWQRKVNAYFRMNELHGIVHGMELSPSTTEKEASASYLKQRGMAAGFISMFIDSTNATHVKDLEEDPAKMWKKLDGIHNAKSPGMRFNALNALFSIRKEDSEDLCSLMTCAEAAMNTYKSLIPTDSTFTLQSLQDELITMSLIRALPDEFNQVRATLGVHTNLTLAVTQQAFITEDNQRQQTAQPTNTTLRMYTHYHQCSNVPSPMPPSET